jgi:hypothetical protein
MAAFEVSVRPIIDSGDGGLTADRGPLWANAEGDDLVAAMTKAAEGAAAQLDARPERAAAVIALDVRVVVAEGAG